MRTKNTINNITMSILSQIIISILGFISRKVFLDSLGIEYLGVNGLLTDVLSIMSLVEGGIGLSIIYNLYKPLAEDERKKVIALVQLYKKAYGLLAIIILLISVSLYPFLGNLMKGGGSISYLSVIYFLFIAKNMFSYLNAHKWSLINADQKGYILVRMNLIFQIFITIAKIIVLFTTQNYILYLVIELIIFALQNIINGKIVDKRYPYIKTKEKHFIDKSTKDNIIKNVKALFFHNIGSFLVFGTDNILISSFIGIATVGLYSNYAMIMGQLSGLLSTVLNGVGASIGNLIATESSEKNYSIFKITYVVNFWLFSICVIFLYNLLAPFINWWLGKEFLLGNITFIIILINFYLTGMRLAIGIFKTKAGLFVQDKYAPLIEAFINLSASLILVKYYGLAGIFLGTTISTIATVFWTQPLIVYKNIFKKSVWSYFAKYGFYVILTIITFFATAITCNALVFGDSFISLILKGIICIIVPTIIYFTVFYKTEEFQYIVSIVKTTLLKSRQNKTLNRAKITEKV